MFANQVQINLTTLGSGATATTINIPITMEYQLVDQTDIINTVFVDSEVKKAINPIIDNEKTRFLPINKIGETINKITYQLNLNGKLTYADIGFTDNDIKFNVESFKQTFLNLAFYDSDNQLTQNLISFITIYPTLTSMDLYQAGENGPLGQPKPASQIFLTFVVENPIINPRGNSQGYHIYDYKDDVTLSGAPKELYMRGTFKNAKTGKSTNLMVNNKALPIDDLINNLHTKYILVKKNNGFYYTIDNTYSKNISYITNNVIVKLYEILAL